MPDDPKALLILAGKQLTTARNALAESDQIRRLEAQLTKEHAALLDSADPEDRTQMKQLGEINAQMQVIPRRQEKTLQRQTEAGVALAETAENLSRAIQTLHAEEKEARITEMAERLRKDFSDQARNVAAGAPIFQHLARRIVPNNTPPAGGSAECHNEPAKALVRYIAHIEDLQTILAEYFANRKTFADPAFGKAA